MTYHARFRERFDERGWMLSEAQIVAVLAFIDSEIARAKAEARDESIHREHKAIAALIEKVEGIEMEPLNHQSWCDYLLSEAKDCARCNCDQSGHFYLQQEMRDILTHLRGGGLTEAAEGARKVGEAIIERHKGTGCDCAWCKSPPQEETECCEKCYDVYYEKDYPANTALEGCTKGFVGCCHKPRTEETEPLNWCRKPVCFVKGAHQHMSPDFNLPSQEETEKGGASFSGREITGCGLCNGCHSGAACTGAPSERRIAEEGEVFEYTIIPREKYKSHLMYLRSDKQALTLEIAPKEKLRPKETPTPQSKCFKDGKIFVCYCGKCENDSYPLPADFPQSREQGGEKCAWAICQNPKDGLAWCREHASPMGFM